MRLQKFLASCGVVSRREAERAIKAGVVRVNGRVCTDPATEVESPGDRVEFDGRRVKPEAPLYRILLKPRECLSTLVEKKDDQGRQRPTLRKYLRDADMPWVVVGPLDYQSEGVLLLTTDGSLAEVLSKRKARLMMTYHVKFQGAVEEEQLGRLLRGFRVDGRLVTPEAVFPLASTGRNTWVELKVKEIRPRALHAAGELIRRRVLKISRTEFGALSFEGLKMGGHRDLNAKEVASLKKSVGLR